MTGLKKNSQIILDFDENQYCVHVRGRLAFLPSNGCRLEHPDFIECEQ